LVDPAPVDGAGLLTLRRSTVRWSPDAALVDGRLTLRRSTVPVS